MYQETSRKSPLHGATIIITVIFAVENSKPEYFWENTSTGTTPKNNFIGGFNLMIQPEPLQRLMSSFD